MINGNIKTKFEINWSNNNCNLVQTNTIDWEPYYETSCKELSEVEYNELASYFDTTLNSNWTEISYEMNMWWESKLRINWKEIKDVLNQLISKDKCTIELKNKYN
jgi:hypothetical protein